MATTATTPSELILAINSTIRTKVTPNSITPQTHSDLLDSVVMVLSADTYTTSGIYDANSSIINFTTSNTGVTYSVSGITDTVITGGTYDASASTITFDNNQGDNFGVTGITVPTTYSVVTTLSASTPTQVTHNLNTANIMVQTWDSNNDLVDMYVGKFSGDTNNVIIVESTVSDTFRINILGL